MTFGPTRWALVALVPVLALAACGGSSNSSSPAPVTVTVTAPSEPTTTSPQTTTPAPSPTVAAPTTTAPAQTRTAPGPAFTRTTGGTPAASDLDAAVGKLRALGFAPLSTRTYDSGQTLRVLVGARTGSADAHTQQAFFFDGPRYLGTDAAATSGQIGVIGHGDTDVTLRYGIYRPGDADCCPSGAPRTVRFALDSGRLVAVDPIPSLASRR
jgi:hypothetical protein